MSGTSAFPIVLDTDSEAEEVEEIEKLTLKRPKDSPLKLIVRSVIGKYCVIVCVILYVKIGVQR